MSSSITRCSASTELVPTTVPLSPCWQGERLGGYERRYLVILEPDLAKQVNTRRATTRRARPRAVTAVNRL